MEAVRQFSVFSAVHGIKDLAQVEPVHVAAFVEDQLREHSKSARTTGLYDRRSDEILSMRSRESGFE